MNNRTMTVTIYKYDQYYMAFKDVVGYMLNENSRLLVLKHVNEGITNVCPNCGASMNNKDYALVCNYCGTVIFDYATISLDEIHSLLE